MRLNDTPPLHDAHLTFTGRKPRKLPGEGKELHGRFMQAATLALSLAVSENRRLFCYW